MTPESIEASTPIAITLQAQEWNQILNVLADAPFRIAAPLINKITEQANKSNMSASAMVAPLPNGGATVNSTN